MPLRSRSNARSSCAAASTTRVMVAKPQAEQQQVERGSQRARPRVAPGQTGHVCYLFPYCSSVLPWSAGFIQPAPRRPPNLHHALVVRGDHQGGVAGGGAALQQGQCMDGGFVVQAVGSSASSTRAPTVTAAPGPRCACARPRLVRLHARQRSTTPSCSSAGQWRHRRGFPATK